MREKVVRRITMLVIGGVLLWAASVGISDVVSVGNSVNGRELPIYSVETPEKKVGLSFDAAWGDV